MTLDNKFDEYYEKNFYQGGTTCCPGCGGPLLWRMVLEALGSNTIVYGDGPCAMCAIRNIKLPTFNIHFSFIADGATGILAALRAKGRQDITVISSGGDGATGDISLGKVSAAAERNENMIQICVDNEAYMNTGIQKSGLTPFGAWTTTTPTGKENNKKEIPMIIAAHRVPYVATASISYPRDLKAKIEKAKVIKGFKYIHTVIPCPTGWRFDPAKSIEVTRLGVDTWAWPLYEIEQGTLKISAKPEQKPIMEYLSAQGRFRQMKPEHVEYLQKEIDSKRISLLESNGRKLFL